MELNDLKFTPHSDIGAKEIDIIKQQEQLIQNGNYSDATTLLDNENVDKGVRASFLNSIQNKVRNLQLYMLNEAEQKQDTYYSDTEPSMDFMDENEYLFWSQPF